jgi:hypothetical protein
MLRILLSFVASLAPSAFSTVSHKRQDFLKKKVTEHRTYVLIFSTNLSETFLILRKIQRDIVIKVKKSSRKVPVILVGF